MPEEWAKAYLLARAQGPLSGKPAFSGPLLDRLIEQLFRLKTKQLPSLPSSGDFWTNLAEVDRTFLEVP